MRTTLALVVGFLLGSLHPQVASQPSASPPANEPLELIWIAWGPGA